MTKEIKLKCPFCKHNQFYRSAKESPCLVYILDDGESIRDDDIGMQVTEYTYVCAKCDKDITEQELIK